jgi:hypothetical protein
VLVAAWPVEDLQGLDACSHGQGVAGQGACTPHITHTSKASANDSTNTLTNPLLRHMSEYRQGVASQGACTPTQHNTTQHVVTISPFQTHATTRRCRGTALGACPRHTRHSVLLLSCTRFDPKDPVQL